ncbi:response regulator transcription factor [Aquimarina sp. MMG016]|uniref:response regulator transcription factor n=1 Tax=Aquimarina sp. MMG016 TaxID=2822690 RepID=UPI001B39F027|nr:response regulator transcription factor [Aquimarina sp. MMG016]MBQ4819607.1 response regulator transcription factor [Aquimarina sp. MMG016]
MFTKIIIAEDIDSENLGIVSSISNLAQAQIDTVQSCDKALSRIKESINKGEPYNLLISDLSFNLDTRIPHKITSGKELIKEAKNIQPDIKIIVFSGEDKSAIIKSLFGNHSIDGYVCKGLYGLSELKKAINQVYQGNPFTCPVSKNALHQKNVTQLDPYEVRLLRLLANGYKQDEISLHFIEKGIEPNSKRSIEDRIRKLRQDFDAKTTIQLIHMVDGMGLIS